MISTVLKFNDVYLCDECHHEIDGDFAGKNSHIVFCARCSEPHHSCSNCVSLFKGLKEIDENKFNRLRNHHISVEELMNRLSLSGVICENHDQKSCFLCSMRIMYDLTKLGYVYILGIEPSVIKPTNKLLEVTTMEDEQIDEFVQEVWLRNSFIRKI